jgi:hyperosmotically inducible periplasmic protein
MRNFTILLFMAIFVGGCADRAARGPRSAQDDATPTVRTADQSADRDNTGVNTRDRNGVLKTPIDQNENRRDVNITADIRKRVVGSEMSLNAHNVKIITQDGLVTLGGPVKNAAEKNTIEAIAKEIAGEGMVVNQLEVEAKP